ncbi:S41 family peptidase [Pedobacter sp. MW01-1-1]|uniref:S41 family peptidase n=1 Tax=Pedobacter sp. MW01-1-1 TaxID=3383027 RepID=UPI003FEDF048
MIVLSVAACKKKSTTPETIEPESTPPTRDELTKDSIFYYTKELYYWYASLPTYANFNPRSYTNNEAELYALTQYSLDPVTGKPFEYTDYSEPKYSFIENDVVTGKVGALKADLDGTANDYGFSVNYQSSNDLRVKYVYEGSPAAAQGLTRTCRITAINGRTDLTYNSATATSIANFINDAIFGTNPSVNITYINPAGQTKSVTIASAKYKLNPILYSHVYDLGTKKVGYFVFNSYTNDVTAQLNTLFADFQSQEITELVIDLRYNGGGYISTAEQIINLAVPASQTGTTMFTYYYNSYLQNLTTAQREASVLRFQPLLDANDKLQPFTTGVNKQYATYADLDYSTTAADNITKFAKLGNLALTRVYFLVSGSTASASELTINCLKPVLDVKVIGVKTYGKPVGFFPIRIDKLDLYIPEFETKNKNGEGGYFSGMTVDKMAYEDLTKAWGDATETLLDNALNYSKTGAFKAVTSTKLASAKEGVATGATLSDEQHAAFESHVDPLRFKGMIRDVKKH